MRKILTLALVLSAILPSSAIAQFFCAHKNNVWQNSIPTAPASPDPAITWGRVHSNIPGLSGIYDPQITKFTLPSGVWHIDFSANVANPADGGKYYALIRKNGQPNTMENFQNAFELFRPVRPRITSPDTAATAVSGLLWMNGTDYFEAVIHISNTYTPANMGGVRYETYVCGHRIADYIDPPDGGELPPPPPPPPPPGTYVVIEAPVTSASYSSNFTVIDLASALPDGAVLNGLEIYQTGARSLAYKIVCGGAGVFSVVYDQVVSHPGGGWFGPAINYMVPAANCYAAAYNAALGNHDTSSVSAPRAYKTGNATGNNVGGWSAPDTGFAWPIRYKITP